MKRPRKASTVELEKRLAKLKAREAEKQKRAALEAEIAKLQRKK
jgi:hypothetical protein